MYRRFLENFDLINFQREKGLVIGVIISNRFFFLEGRRKIIDSVLLTIEQSNVSDERQRLRAVENLNEKL